MLSRPLSLSAADRPSTGLRLTRTHALRGSDWRQALACLLAGWLPVSWLMAALSVSVGPLHMHHADSHPAHGPALWGTQMLMQAGGRILDLAAEMSAAQARWTGVPHAGPHRHASPADAAIGTTGGIQSPVNARGLRNGHAHHGVSERHHHRPDDRSVIPLSPVPDADLADLLSGLALSLLGPSTTASPAVMPPVAQGKWPLAHGPCWCSHQPSLPERPPRA